MTEFEDSPSSWLTDEGLIVVAKLRKIRSSYGASNIIDMLNRENCKIADKVREAGHNKEFDKFCKKYTDYTKCKKQEVIDKIDKYCSKQDILKAGDKFGDLTTKMQIEDCPVDLGLPPGFQFSAGGIYNYNSRLACYTPVVPINYINNIDSGLERYEIAIRNPKTAKWDKTIVANASTLFDSKKVIKLTDEGLATDSTAAKYLSQFCGVAGEVFIKELMKHKDSDFIFIRDIFNDCLNMLMPQNETYLGEHLKSAALLMAGDILASLWLFNYEQKNAFIEAAKFVAKPLIDKLPNRNDLSDANKAWRFVVEWVAANRQHFWGGTENDKNGDPRPPVSEIFGEIKEDEYVAIFPSYYINIKCRMSHNI